MAILLTVSVISTIPAADKTATVKVGLPFLSFMDGTTQFYRLNPDSGELEGYAVDMFREIEKKDPSLSFEFEVIEVESDPDTISDLAYDAGCDIILGSFVTFEETEHYDVFPGDQTWLHSRLVYVSNNPDAPDVVTFDDLAGSEIVIPDVIQQMIDYKFSDYNDTTPGLQITYVTKDPSQLGMIMTEIRNGDYDDAIVFPSLLNPYLTDLSEYKISPVPELDKDMCSPMGWVYLKEHKELARRVAEELKQMMKNGELSDLSRAYFGIDLTVPTEPEFLDYYYQVYPDMK